MFITPFLGLLTLGLYILDKRLKTRVLFICTRDDGRSQMSRAYMTRKYGWYFNILSASWESAEEMQSVVKELLQEERLLPYVTTPISLNSQIIKNAVNVLEDNDSRTIAFLCNKLGNNVPLGKKGSWLHWEDLDDPSGKSLEEARTIFKHITKNIDLELIPLISPRREVNTNRSVSGPQRSLSFGLGVGVAILLFTAGVFVVASYFDIHIFNYPSEGVIFTRGLFGACAALALAGIFSAIKH